jgi:uridine kinase
VDVFSAVVADTPRPSGGPALVAVDGVDGSGKTLFAGQLAIAYERAGRTAFVVHEDDFLNPRSIRYRLGRDSPQGFFLDTYDLAALSAKVLDASTLGGGLTITPAVFDHRADAAIDADPVQVPPGGVLIVEGMFLHRDELVGRWDLSVFLDVPFTETVRRLAERDGSNADPEHPSMRRYVEGQRIYLSRCRPRERATLVVDNTDPADPRITAA